MKKSVYSVPVRSFDKMSPDHVRITARVADVYAALDAISRGPNPRTPSEMMLNPAVPAMLTTLDMAPELFHHGKGLAIVAASYERKGDTLVITCEEREPGKDAARGHGLIDGGHTMHAIKLAHAEAQLYLEHLAKRAALEAAYNAGAIGQTDGKPDPDKLARLMRPFGARSFARMGDAEVCIEINVVDLKAADANDRIVALSTIRNTGLAVDMVRIGSLAGRYSAEVAKAIGADDVIIQTAADAARTLRAGKLTLSYRATAYPSGGPSARCGLDAAELATLRALEKSVSAEWTGALVKAELFFKPHTLVDGEAVTREATVPAGKDGSRKRKQYVGTPTALIYGTMRGLGMFAGMGVKDAEGGPVETRELAEVAEAWNTHGPAVVRHVLAQLAPRLNAGLTLTELVRSEEFRKAGGIEALVCEFLSEPPKAEAEALAA